MSLDIDSLPLVEGGGRLGRRPAADDPIGEQYRLQAATAGQGSRLDLNALALVLNPDAVRLLQERRLPGVNLLARVTQPLGGSLAPSYTQYFDCSSYQYAGLCESPCFGFADHHMDAFYCATCDEQAADPVQNPAYNWHFVGSRGQLQYWDREPDVCLGRDAWKWQVANCGSCTEAATFRCHDGYKRYADGTVEPTICEGLVVCDGKLTTC